MNKYFPWTEDLPTPVVTGLATLGPVGLWGKAPGTNGSVAGMLLYLVFFHHKDNALVALLLVAFLVYLAIGICGEAEKRFGQQDPGKIILDEFVAVPICFFGVEAHVGGMIPWLIAGFVLFRFFDIVKPLGIKHLQNLHGGFGVVADDVAAALYVCVVLNVAEMVLFWV